MIKNIFLLQKTPKKKNIDPTSKVVDAHVSNLKNVQDMDNYPFPSPTGKSLQNQENTQQKSSWKQPLKSSSPIPRKTINSDYITKDFEIWSEDDLSIGDNSQNIQEVGSSFSE